MRTKGYTCNKVLQEAMLQDIKDANENWKTDKPNERKLMETIAINLRLEGGSLTEIATFLYDRFNKRITKQALSLFFNKPQTQHLLAEELREIAQHTRQARFTQNLKLLGRCHKIIDRILDKVESKQDEGKELRTAEIVLVKELYVDKSLVSYAVGRDAAGMEDPGKVQTDEEKIESWEEESKRVEAEVEQESADRLMTDEEAFAEAKKIPEYIIALNKIRLGKGLTDTERESLLRKFGSFEAALQHIEKEEGSA